MLDDYDDDPDAGCHSWDCDDELDDDDCLNCGICEWCLNCGVCERRFGQSVEATEKGDSNQPEPF
jgi:hypothetical protein